MPAPSAFVSVYLDRLATTLAKSTAFQAAVGVADEAAARARIVQVSTAIARPRAIVNYAEDFRLAHGTTSSRDVSGFLEILLEWNVPAAYVPGSGAFDQDGAIIDYRNKAGAILEEMHALTRPAAFTDDCLSLRFLQMAGEDFFTDETTGDPYVCGLVRVQVAGQ